MARTDLVVSVHIRWPWLVAFLWYIGARRLSMLLVRVDQVQSQH